MDKIITQLPDIINTFLNKAFTSLADGSGEWENNIKETLDDFIVDVIVTQLKFLDDAFFNSADRKRGFLPKIGRRLKLLLCLVPYHSRGVAISDEMAKVGFTILTRCLSSRSNHTN